jgi:hypothetical protein
MLGTILILFDLGARGCLAAVVSQPRVGVHANGGLGCRSRRCRHSPASGTNLDFRHWKFARGSACPNKLWTVSPEVLNG